MKNRQPFELKKAIQVYNILQVVVSSYLVYGVRNSYWEISRYPNNIHFFSFFLKINFQIGFKVRMALALQLSVPADRLFGWS